jgi:phospholipid-binding lipoprotein MlaA
MALDSTKIALSAAALALLFLAGCATAPRAPSAEIKDPYEATNRKALALNQSLFGPLARAYHAGTPSVVRDGLSNVSNNLKEPRIFANDLLQLRLGAGSTTVARFLVNTTFGVGGLFDVASIGNIPKQSGDFGQTLFVWGVDDGPYLVSPFFGPGTARDTAGLAVDEIADPASWAIASTVGDQATIGFAALDFVTQIDQLKQAEDSSIDFYTFLRSSYYQSRRAQLREAVGLPPNVESPADIQPPPAPRKHRKPKK